MISFDVQHLANSLLMETGDTYAVKEEIAIRMVEAAIDIINEPRKQDAILDPLNHIWETHYGLVTPDLVILAVVDDLQKQIRQHNWDTRLVVKPTFKKVSNTFHRATVQMDLDATLARQKTKPKKKAAVRAQVTATTVSDNPSAEDINEFLDVVERRSERRTPLLSDRHPKFIAEPFARDRRD